jgi:hypothetical protein
MRLSQPFRGVDTSLGPVGDQSICILRADFKIAQLASEVCLARVGRLDRLNRRPVIRHCDYDCPLRAEHVYHLDLVVVALRLAYPLLISTQK